MSAYGTDAGFTAYATARGEASVGAASEADRDAARLRASEFIDGKFGHRFPGWRADGRDQVREWPRSFAADREGWPIDVDEIPDEIERATYEAAVRELATPGSLTPDVTLTAREISKTETVGPISETTRYAGGASVGAAEPVLTILEKVLARLINTSRLSTQMGRG